LRDTKALFERLDRLFDVAVGTVNAPERELSPRLREPSIQRLCAYGRGASMRPRGIAIPRECTQMREVAVNRDLHLGETARRRELLRLLEAAAGFVGITPGQCERQAPEKENRGRRTHSSGESLLRRHLAECLCAEIAHLGVLPG